MSTTDTTDESGLLETLASTDAEDTRPMQDAIVDDSLASLGYEEWLTPVRLTGNKIVVEAVMAGQPVKWFEVRRDLIHVIYNPGGGSWSVLPGTFQSMMTRMEHDPHFELRPRLRENTPLGGDES